MGVIALNTIKTAVKSILDTANAVGGSPIDLSQNLLGTGSAGRVQKILMVNVEKIPIQPSFFPCITMFYDSKAIELADMAKDMATGRRWALIDLKIVALLWNDNIQTTDFQLMDPADNDIENLMENIEHIMRSNSTISSNVFQCHPTDVSYHTFPVSEDAHMRAGIMNLRIKVLY